MDRNRMTRSNYDDDLDATFFGKEPIVIGEDDINSFFSEKEEQNSEDIIAKMLADDDESEENITPLIIEDVEETKNNPVLESYTFENENTSTNFAKNIEREDVVQQAFEDASEEFMDSASIPSSKERSKETPIVAELEEVVETRTKVKKKKRRSIFAIFLNLLAVCFFLFIVFETVIAFLNFNLIKQNKEPAYFVTTTKKQSGEYKYTIHDMGLFKIIRKEDDREFEIKLLPFFLDI